MIWFILLYVLPVIMVAAMLFWDVYKGGELTVEDLAKACVMTLVPVINFICVFAALWFIAEEKKLWKRVIWRKS